ncbi:hypothetical protein OCV99_04500 [Dorea acetigenes]|jgi:hypothetical protein|uniref:Rpn family recombination-promoting nuclease/putative transposase n=1 Tax=Dorea acetigenes TaxID=2981787 RepID=A0ABT2RK91_9FIRM|nr:hypothetical protein [Dorea acetigenes]MCU6685827.1 hypothetical protein [Dorea acetigenes]SCI67281.1 Uncharacterised protein [uncultured Clostridium sp.]
MEKHDSLKEKTNSLEQHEDIVLKTAMREFSKVLLPWLGITEKVVGYGPTENIYLEAKKMFQDFTLIMENGTWKHFEFQSTNEGIDGLKRFRMYEAVTSYQHKVSVTTYVLFSGNILNPVTEYTEGVNTYRIIPIIMRDQNADWLFSRLQQKLKEGQVLTKEDLVPLMLSPLMSGKMTQKERMRTAFQLIREATAVSEEDIRKIEAVLYAMTDKFLSKEELEEFLEEISMTRLGEMLIDKGISQGISQGVSQGISQGINKAKIENARNLLDVLDVQTISEKIGLPLETVQQLKNEQ